MASALLAGMCLGFLPHNFFPARIFMGDIGAMLLGLLLAYGPISSTASLQPALLTNYSDHHTLDRFPTFLPLLVPAAIFVIPYADLMFAIIRRTRAGKPLMVADRQHLHHRLMNIGHSYRKSVLLMYLWAALFSVAVVSLSLVRSPLIVFAAATLVAVLALLAATMPRLRPWRALARRKAALAAASRAAAAAVPVAPAAAGYSRAAPPGALPPDARPPGPAFNSGSAPRYPGHPYSAAPAFPRDPLPRAGRLPNADPFAPSPPQDRFTGAAPPPGQDRLPAPAPLPDGHRFAGPAPFPDGDRFQGQAPVPDGDRFPGPSPFPPQAHFPELVRPCARSLVLVRSLALRRFPALVRSLTAPPRASTRFRRPSAPTRSPDRALADLRMTRPLPFWPLPSGWSGRSQLVRLSSRHRHPHRVD